jgi:nucleotide-binding universal stress UspA family protein
MGFFPATILLATDGSEEANRALKMSVDLAKSTGSDLHVVLVEELPYAYDAPAVREPTSGFFAELHERARKRLDRELAKVRLAGGTVAEAHPRVGTAAREVVALAEEMGAGLIVVGSRGLGGLRRALVGSVSLGVVRHAHCSVIVVRGSEDRDGEGHLLGKVLLAYDGSKEATAAAGVAAEIANATGSALHLLHVVPIEGNLPPLAYAPYEEAEAWQAWEAGIERDEERARSFVEGQARRMEAQGAKVDESHLAFGRPEEEIVRLAEDLNAGLVVVGSRGRGGIRRALVGSVSESLVRHVHCPVMVVRPEKDGA